jgi:flagellar biosynthetic protein FliQ
MLAQTRENDLQLFAKLSGKSQFASAEDVPLTVLIPTFITSELKTAFQIGFMVFIPFLVIDLVVASVLMSMGMMMLSPVLVSLPFKIMLFVVVDGWTLLIGTLAASFHHMTPETVMDLAHKTLMVTTMIAAPLLLIALIAGLVIGMLQAATQINESTLSFIPKLLLLVLTLFVAGPWILRVLIDFTRDLYASIPC